MKDWKKILATIELFFVFASLLILGKLAIIGQHQLTQPGLELPSQYISAMSMALGILAIPICGISWLLFWEMRSKKKISGNSPLSGDWSEFGLLVDQLRDQFSKVGVDALKIVRSIFQPIKHRL